jgi:hypothetical protein
MKTVSSKIVYKEKASRLELFVRILYAIPVLIVFWILGILAGIAEIILWVHILILGRRHKSLSELITLYVNYMFKVAAYLNLTTDERPPIIPENK